MSTQETLERSLRVAEAMLREASRLGAHPSAKSYWQLQCLHLRAKLAKLKKGEGP